MTEKETEFQILNTSTSFLSLLSPFFFAGLVYYFNYSGTTTRKEQIFWMLASATPSALMVAACALSAIAFVSGHSRLKGWSARFLFAGIFYLFAHGLFWAIKVLWS